jgi:hypothetical protein
MKVLTVTEGQLQRLQRMALRNIMQTSIDALNNPGELGPLGTAAELHAAVECYAALAAADERAAPLPYEPGALNELRAAGVDPQKEYGERDPVGYQYCTHGRHMQQPCELCDATEARNPVQRCPHDVPLTQDCQGCRDDHAAGLTASAAPKDDAPAS